jgi:tetratricopeptide (TPR) repeat protein
MTPRGGVAPRWSRWPTLLACAGLLAVGCSAEPVSHRHETAGTTAATPPLFDNLGRYHRGVTTTSPPAQAYFDQGLRLAYGFNHYEAQAAFREALRLDPACGMCAWGIALTYGSNYNSPTDVERERGALAAVTQAQALSAAAGTERERAIIGALAARHSASPGADRAALDRAYADAMREVARRFPDDLDAATLFADALMNLRPWSLWTPAGAPQPGTAEIVATLERVLAVDPMHPGANHLYIHAVEASPDPRRAEAAADRLLRLMPGAGHMVHMPSHIYYRIGRYADAASVNVQAVAADRVYFTKSRPSPIYRGMYYPHNLDFIWHAAGMEGRGAECVRAAREFAAEVPTEAVLEMPDMETAPAAPLLALVRFARWDEALAQPAPPARMLYVTGAWRYARGLALVATGRRDEAARELAELGAVRQSVPAERTLAGFFKMSDMLALASEVLAGEIAARGGDADTAVKHLAEAVRMQDEHWFTEPPPWYYPVRQSLGAALLQVGRAAEAEAVYREDLRRNPENGWSLFGLAQSLRAQGKTADAAAVDQRFRRAWVRADVALTSSRF